MNFNGTNPNRIIIIDNCSIHCRSDVVGLLREVGVMVHFLSPYSPDFSLKSRLF